MSFFLRVAQTSLGERAKSSAILGRQPATPTPKGLEMFGYFGICNLEEATGDIVPQECFGFSQKEPQLGVGGLGNLTAAAPPQLKPTQSFRVSHLEQI